MSSAVTTLDGAREPASSQAQRSALVSVLIPLEDHRDSAERSIRAWCTGQTFDRDRYEVIAIASSSFDERRLAPIRKLLGPHDRLVRTSAAHDIAQVAEAAALARGEFLFFSESHVWPSPDVLELSLRAMELHPDWAGLTCGSKRIAHNRVAAAEADMYERDFAIGANQLGWRNILDQCFLTRRASYRAAGGFDAALGHFAEWVLAARYRTEGLVVGHCPDIELWHVFSGDAAELARFTADFVRGEMTYLARDSAARREALIESPLEWSCRGDRRRDLAGYIVRLVAGEVLRARRERRTPTVSWKSALKYVPVAIAGGRPARVAAAWRAIVCRASLMLAQCGSNRSVAPAFERCMATIIRRARLSWADAFFAPRRTSRTGELWSADPDWGNVGAGLHEHETVDDVTFRWSEPVAAVALDVPPGRYRIHVNMLWSQLANRSQQPAFFLNAKPIADLRVANGGNSVSFVADLRRSGKDRLGWICPPASAPGDRRRLGLPLVSILATAGDV
ncbi:MAG: hypothetical protein QOF71_2165 [Candidatus Eremiobacteraeota bacterium]|nr:hypothetical protein [Candidatus Eremiobacteraeota bacterium]